MHKKSFLFLLVCLFAGNFAFSQKHKNRAEIPLLIFPHRDTVTLGEFEYAYQKNNGGYEEAKKHSKDQYKEYVNLYILFKRKVLAAEDAGLDTLAKFQEEYESYARQLSKGYLADNEEKEKMLQEAIERSQEEIAASHILLRISPNARPEDTLKKYNLALAIRDSVLKHGKSFEEMALKYSQDPSVKINKGFLGYFTVFDMVYPFETAAYNTHVGEISMPVRTEYGYHLVFVKDRRPGQSKKRASHIIVRWGPVYEAKTKEEAERRIMDIYDRLEKGESFEELAKKYSDDPRTASRGGDLGFARLIPELDSAKQVTPVGKHSKPFLSPFGYHILKVTDEQKLPEGEALRKLIRNKLTNSGRLKFAEKKYLQTLRKKYHLKYYDENIKALKNASGDKYYNGKFTVDSLPHKVRNLILAEFDGGSVSVADLFAFKQQQFRFSKMPLEATIRKDLEALLDNKLLEYERSLLPSRYPEYKYLLNEYRDGVLLFAVMDKEVWQKALKDTTGLKKFYEAHRDSFQAGERVIWYEFSSSDKEMLEKLRKKLQTVSDPAAYIDTLPKDNEIKNIVAIRLFGEINKGNETADYLYRKGKGYVSDLEKEGANYKFKFVLDTKLAGTMSFDEAKARAVTLYQNHLQKEWEKEISKKYPVKINKKALKLLFR